MNAADRPFDLEGVVPPMQDGDVSLQVICTGFGVPIGAIYKQKRGTSRRVYRAEHRSGRWARFTSYGAAMTWIGTIERGGRVCDGEAKPWPDPTERPSA